MRAFFIFGLTLAVCVSISSQQLLAAQSPSTTPVAAKAGPTERLSAECLSVKGSVQWAPIGARATDKDAWKPVKQGERYHDGIQIRTGLRSAVVLKFGDDTVAKVDRVTLAAIGEFHRTGDVKRIRFGLDYGAIRAGVAEEVGELRSDLEIDAPSVTLSKRGTWDFELRVERGTGRFEARLADRGLVEVLQKATGRTRQIRPQQWVNQAMKAWVETAKFDREIVVADAFSQTAEELLAYIRNSTGRTGLQPAGIPTGDPISPTGGTQAQAAAAAAPTIDVGRTASRTTALNLLRAQFGTGGVPSDDGDFGTGSGFHDNTAQKRMSQRVTRIIANMPLLRRAQVPRQ